MLPIWIVVGAMYLIYLVALAVVLILAALVRLALHARTGRMPPNGSTT